MKNESTSKILTVSLGICFVCAILVATTAVTLNPIQRQNQENDKLKNILSAAGLLTDEAVDLQAVFNENIRAEIIDLKTGHPVKSEDLPESLQPEKFDIKAIAKNVEFTTPLSAKEDIAQIKIMPEYMIVYAVMENDSVLKWILPMYGKGLWSTMYGFLALNADLKTIEAFTFYEHGETPGLGGEVDNPRWKNLWIGKQAFDASGDLKIQVIKGHADMESSNAKYQIDGLSGSTLTTRGVNNLVRFWLGNLGWGTYINNLRNNSGL